MNSLKTSRLRRLIKSGYLRYFRYQGMRFYHDQNENTQEAIQNKRIEDETIIHDEDKDRENFRKVESKRLLEFRKKLREQDPNVAEDPFGKTYDPKNPLPPWPNDINPHTGEIGGPKGPEPTRYGDWERKGICVDF